MKAFHFRVIVFTLGGLLGLYGLFYHISSSEFWPMTISKTWFNPSHFESSLLQKPLFSIFLSLFHLLPLSNVSHLLAVKAVFSILGLLALYFWSQSFTEQRGTKPLIFTFLLVSVSPLLLQNFFRVRSDQLSFLFFAAALFFLKEKKTMCFFTCLALLFLTSIKSVLFFVPAAFLFQTEIKKILTQTSLNVKIYFGLSLCAISVWILALNTGGAYYLAGTIESSEKYSNQLLGYLKTEWPLLLLSMISAALLKQKKVLPTGHFMAALACLLLVYFWPQPLPFFAASFLLIIYLPVFQFIYSNHVSLKTKKILFSIGFFSQISNLVVLHRQEKISLFISNQEQINYIEKIGFLTEKYNLTYLDGAGILPKQRFIPCFISPEDLNANTFCLEQIKNHTADSYIITQRLASLGPQIYPEIAKEYTQIRSNFWVRNQFAKQFPKEEIDLYGDSLPILIFGSE